MSPRHPAKRSRQARQVVTDTIELSEWVAAERAQTRRDEAVTRFLHACSWCVVVLTATVVGLLILDAVQGR
jgi:nicotinamide riboside transporter PnuC